MLSLPEHTVQSRGGSQNTRKKEQQPAEQKKKTTRWLRNKKVIQLFTTILFVKMSSWINKRSYMVILEHYFVHCEWENFPKVALPRTKTLCLNTFLKKKRKKTVVHHNIAILRATGCVVRFQQNSCVCAIRPSYLIHLVIWPLPRQVGWFGWSPVIIFLISW